MAKLLQINPVIRKNTSTGKIMQEIGELAMKKGWESYIAYSKGRDGADPNACKSTIVPVGSKLSVAIHGIETRILDRHGLGSRLATKRFISNIRRINPDIIHIHNVHGYFLNYKALFRYLADSGKPVIWTVHDCWLYTGHCYYYSAARCFKWKTGCEHCPQTKAFPASFAFDRSKKNYSDKAKAFNSLARDKFIIAPVSEWIGSELKQSYLKDCKIRVFHNGIDTDTFRPMDTASVREKYSLGDKYVILGLASIWMKEKGFDDMMQIAQRAREGEVVVMVGKMTKEQQDMLPENVICIARTDNQKELAELYSAATIFVNPTWQDNYPTVNLEAISCGTPVVTYRTGGSPESIVEDETGFVMEQGDVTGLIAAIRYVEQAGKERFSDKCRRYALDNLRKEDRYQDYIDLYESLITR